MRCYAVVLTLALSIGFPPAAFADEAAVAERIAGEPLDSSAIRQGVVESMFDMIARDRTLPPAPPKGERNGAQGRWVIPSARATYFPHSGEHNLVNEWGDTRMAIRFPRTVNLHGAYVAGQAGAGAWTRGIRVLGYLGERHVGTTEWFEDIGENPTWFEIGLDGVDRMIVEAVPVLNGGGWYALDDLSFTIPPRTGTREQARMVVLDFEDATYGQVLTGSEYAELTWETGTGDFDSAAGVPAPQSPGVVKPAPADDTAPGGTRGGLGTIPDLEQSFQGPIRGDSGSFSYPPDTCGAVGPNHFVAIVNRNFGVYNKATGARLVNISLNGLFSPFATNGDPRVLYDQHSDRWIAISTQFSAGATIQLAVSTSSDPTGAWFKAEFLTASGSDASCWPDYPTLGVDASGVYITAYMVGCSMSAFVIDKSPLVAPVPSLGAVTAFRALPYEQAIQPAHTYGSSGGEFLISRSSGNSLRVRQVSGPLNSPTLNQVGFVSIPSHSTAPDAPALGSSTPLDTVDTRLMNAVYRDGSIWTAHTVSVGGRAACRWYEINPHTNPPSLIQSGTISDSVRHYYFPSIAVNLRGDAVMGFSGSSAAEFAAGYYTGRLAQDPPGEMGIPALLKAGVAAQNNIDSVGRNRWGDYSLTSLDPDNELRLWTIQEYGHATNIWGTYIGRLEFGDCNGNGIDDELDIAQGTSEDCNLNELPDECELGPRDCNDNGTPDDCDIAEGAALDCNANEIPDSCDIASGQSPDCNANGVPDLCDVGPSGISDDCNLDGVPDECQLVANDCNGNSRPDECDSADLATTITGPGHLQRCPDAAASFSVTAPGATAYQWLRNGQILAESGAYSGTGTSTLTIDPAADGGDLSTYRCRVTFGCVDALSTIASLDVLPTDITVSLLTQSPVSGCAGAGQTVVFKVSVNDPAGAIYQWSRDGFDLQDDAHIFGTQSAQLEIDDATGDDSGVYTCRVWNDCIVEAEAVTTAGVLALVDPVITQQPVDACVDSGGDAVFEASAESPLPLIFRWYEGVTLLNDDIRLSGTTTNTLTLHDVEPADDGRQFHLRAVVSDPFCSAFSLPATLSVPAEGSCPTCANAPGDMDGDGDFDLVDMQRFTACFGVNVLVETACGCANVDLGNQEVDLADWSALNNILTGPQ